MVVKQRMQRRTRSLPVVSAIIGMIATGVPGPVGVYAIEGLPDGLAVAGVAAWVLPAEGDGGKRTPGPPDAAGTSVAEMSAFVAAIRESEQAERPGPSGPGDEPSGAVVPTIRPAPFAERVEAPSDRKPRWEVLGEQALARVRFDWTGLGWSVDFLPGRRGRLGFADNQRRVVEVYVRDSHTVNQISATLAHELTHVIDYARLTAADHDRWLEARGLTIDWWPPCSCDDRDYGAGDLAEAAVILVAGRGEWTGHFGQPTDAQLAVAAQLLGWHG